MCWENNTLLSFLMGVLYVNTTGDFVYGGYDNINRAAPGRLKQEQ